MSHTQCEDANKLAHALTWHMYTSLSHAWNVSPEQILLLTYMSIIQICSAPSMLHRLCWSCHLASRVALSKTSALACTFMIMSSKAYQCERLAIVQPDRYLAKYQMLQRSCIHKHVVLWAHQLLSFSSNNNCGTYRNAEDEVSLLPSGAIWSWTSTTGSHMRVCQAVQLEPPCSESHCTVESPQHCLTTVVTTAP